MVAGEIVQVINALGLQTKDCGEYYSLCCPIHKDTKPSAAIYKNSAMFDCFSQCGDMHITKLYKQITGKSAYKDLKLDMSWSTKGKKKKKSDESEFRIAGKPAIRKLNIPDEIVTRNTKKKRTKPDYFAGWSQLEKGVDIAPDLNTHWYSLSKKDGGPGFGEEIQRWVFTRNNKDVMVICRFSYGKKKCDKPFTLWQDDKTKKIKWRNKALSTLYPLYNYDLLKEALLCTPPIDIILFEGQKDAGVAEGILVQCICTGWYGGANAVDKSDWSVLKGLNVYFCPDNDKPGFKAIREVKEQAVSVGFNLTIVYPPGDKDKGWSLADDMEDKEQLDILHIIHKTGKPVVTHKKRSVPKIRKGK